MDRGESGFGVPRFSSSAFFGHRMTAVDARLQEANRRAHIHENFVFFAKLFGFALHRFTQIVNVAYSLLALLFGLSFFYSLVETTRVVLQMVTFAIIVVLLSTLLFPSEASFTKNLGQAVQLARLQRHSAWKELLPEAAERDLVLSESANRLLRILGAFSLSHQLHPLGIQDVSMVSAELLLTVQYCLVTHAALSLLFLVVLLASFRVFFQMLEIL
uniref:Reticulon-like protein n=1 Tax=Steinernema glaseri TaxID=37863 RepID=A0A1I7ZFD5_9BILA